MSVSMSEKNIDFDDELLKALLKLSRDEGKATDENDDDQSETEEIMQPALAAAAI